MISAAGSYRPQLVDVWSLGVVLFAMLTGHLPFCDPDTHTLYRKILGGQLNIPAHVSPPARHLLENMLAVAPNKRYGFEQIRRHEWFQTVRPMVVRGLAKG
jgi:serine/threonine protein kinase